MRNRWRAAGGVVLVATLLLSGCDSQKIAQLEEGVATEADVRARFGEPVAVYAEADGGKTFDYPRQPEGQRNYMITVGADGRMSALRQVLAPANFARVTPGLDQAQVRRLLGPPARTQSYALKNEDVWDWRYLDNQESKLFSVTFDRNGVVAATGSSLDPQRALPGG